MSLSKDRDNRFRAALRRYGFFGVLVLFLGVILGGMLLRSSGWGGPPPRQVSLHRPALMASP